MGTLMLPVDSVSEQPLGCPVSLQPGGATADVTTPPRGLGDKSKAGGREEGGTGLQAPVPPRCRQGDQLRGNERGRGPQEVRAEEPDLGSK